MNDVLQISGQHRRLVRGPVVQHPVPRQLLCQSIVGELRARHGLSGQSASADSGALVQGGGGAGRGQEQAGPTVVVVGRQRGGGGHGRGRVHPVAGITLSAQLKQYKEIHS